MREFLVPALSVVTPLSVVPLTVIIFYLRAIREHHEGWHRDLIRRIESLERRGSEYERRLRHIHRDYTAKEEWLRESLYTRHLIQKLIGQSARRPTDFTPTEGNPVSPGDAE